MVDASERCHRCHNIIPQGRGVILVSTVKQGYLLPFHQRCAIRQQEDDYRWVRREQDGNPKYRDWYAKAIQRYLDLTENPW